jgi:hypothetical protein
MVWEEVYFDRFLFSICEKNGKFRKHSLGDCNLKSFQCTHEMKFVLGLMNVDLVFPEQHK